RLMPVRVNHDPCSPLFQGAGTARACGPAGANRWSRSMNLSTACCVTGCGGSRTHDVPLQTGQGPCAEHLLLASVDSRALLQSAARRLARLQRSWDDDRVFEEITGRGRYLAFCALLETAHDHVDRARERVRSEVLGAAGDLHPSSPSI